MANPNAGILEEIEEQKLSEISIGADDGSNTITLVSLTGGCPSFGTWCFDTVTLDTICGSDPAG